MSQGTLSSRLRAVTEHVAAVWRPDALTLATVEASIADWAAIERMAHAQKLRAAAQAEEIGLDSEGSVARASGVTSHEARRQARARSRLAATKKAADAFDKGKLSDTQAKAIADAADASPAAEDTLLGMVADGASTADVVAEAQRIRRDALDADGSLASRQRQMRTLKHWTDAMGMTCIYGKFEPVVGEKLVTEFTRRADRLFREQVRAKGGVDTIEQRQADALAEIVSHADSGGRKRGPRTIVHLVVSYDAAQRGHVEPGERCETAQGRPIPMGAIDDAFADPDTKVNLAVLAENGVDIASIVTNTRHIPQRIRDALIAQGVMCCVPGCGRTKGLQLDHVADFAKGGPTSAANLKWKCPIHHPQKTEGRYRMASDENGDDIWQFISDPEERARARAKRGGPKRKPKPG